MEKLESLLLENPSQILQNTFENIRKENSFSVEAFQKILDEKGQDFF